MLGEYGETYVVDWGLAERLPAKHRIQNLPLDGGTPTSRPQSFWMVENRSHRYRGLFTGSNAL